MFFSVINPSLKITGSSFLQSTTEDSMPTSHPSKSKISEISQVGPCNFLKSCFTCSAEVGLTPPDLFALGAKIGVSHFEIKSKVNRETEISGEKIKLHIPAEKCCIYENNKLI